MKKALILCLLSCVVAMPLTGQTSATPETRAIPLLVSTGWLEKHLNDPNLLILHVSSNNREYKRGHIPGARFLWTQALAYSNEEVTLEMPSPAQADSVLRRVGIREAGPIVIAFEGGNVSPVTRVLVALEYLGLTGRVSLLDGGFDLWKKEGRQITPEVPVPGGGTVRVQLHPEMIVDAAWVSSHLSASDVAIVDARAKQFYDGQGGGMPRAGHIPGAVNIPFSSVVDSANKLKDTSALRTMFEAAGIRPGKTVVTYCHIGQQATLVLFAARLLGYEAKLYDGSFDDWSSREGLPVVNPASEK